MKRSAFTLIELMIVIVIMGVVYTLAINNFSRLTNKSKSLSLENLKEYLNSLDYTKDARLLCLDDCSKCSIYLDGNKTKSINSFLDDSVKTYRYDSNYGFIQKEPEPFFNADGVEENVCFSYTLDNNKIGDQVLIAYKNKFYDMSTYLQNTPIYNSLQDAKDAKENLANAVLR